MMPYTHCNLHTQKKNVTFYSLLFITTASQVHCLLHSAGSTESAALAAGVMTGHIQNSIHKGKKGKGTVSR